MKNTDNFFDVRNRKMNTFFLFFFFASPGRFGTLMELTHERYFISSFNFVLEASANNKT